MKTNIKNYVNYYIKSNKNLLVLISVLLFILMPFNVYMLYMQGGAVSFTVGNHIVNQQTHASFATLAGCSAVGGFILGFLGPLYHYRFIYKRRSCDLYFSLPIKKRTLFDIHYLLGLGTILVPFLINALLGSLVVFISDLSTGKLLLCFYPIMVLCIIIIYTFINFFVQKCNNLLDALFVTACWIILPITIVSLINSFIFVQTQHIFVGVGYGYNELLSMDVMMSLVSLPYLFTLFITNLVNGTYGQFNWLYMLYWVVIALACFYFGRKDFIARKEEDAQQQTVSRWTFPTIILVVTTCLILQLDLLQDIVPLIFVALAYLIMIFFSKRKIQVTFQTILNFAIICVASFLLSFAFRETKGFGVMQEIPEIDKVASVAFSFDSNKGFPVDKNNDIMNITYKYKDVEETIGIDYYYSSKIKSKDEIEMLINTQKYFIDIDRDNKYGNSNNEQRFNVRYRMKDGTEKSRDYKITNKSDRQQTENVIETLMNNGHIMNPSGKQGDKIVEYGIRDK
ncbi:MAG: hypothetical protein RR481_09760 [Longicatena sp.]